MRLVPIALCLSAAFLLAGCDSDGGQSAAPVANNDSVQTRPGETVTVNVLRNDTGSDLTIASFQSRSASGGTVVEADGNQLRYTPRAGFVGSDFFTYIARSGNGTESKSATVSVSVQ